MNDCDKVWLYPMSSCSIENCKKEYDIPKGSETNMSVNGCELSPYFDCYYKALLEEKLVPCDDSGRTDINPQSITNKLATGFGKVPCNISGCSKDNYLSLDPRLFDVPRAEYLRLDQP